jgi:hypothetical protein
MESKDLKKKASHCRALSRGYDSLKRRRAKAKMFEGAAQAYERLAREPPAKQGDRQAAH